MSFFILEICSSKGAYETKPGKKIKLDIDATEKILLDNGYEIVCNAKVMLIIKNRIETSVYPDGRLLLRTDLKDDAKDSAEKIYRLLRKAPQAQR